MTSESESQLSAIMASTPEESFDFVIIGGGTAGLVLATRISGNPSLGRVLVLEDGDDQTEDMRVSFPAMWPNLISTALNWALETAPQVSRQFGGPVLVH